MVLTGSGRMASIRQGQTSILGAIGLTDKKGYRLIHRSRNSRELASTTERQIIFCEDIKEMSDYVTNLGKTGDAKLILEYELALLQEERQYLSNSTVQKGSLDTAIEGAMATLDLLEKVQSPESYRAVDATHVTRKRRSGGLPLDEAREFFKSHNSRLLNLDKAVLSDEEKELIDSRRANIRKAGKIYVALQKQTLGIAAQRPG